jgi:hypothetical protein
MTNIQEYGHVTSGSTRSLMADLTPPLCHGSEIAIELLQHGPELWPSNTRFQWRWEVKHGDETVIEVTSSERYTYRIPSNSTSTDLSVKCTLTNRGADTNISIDSQYSCRAGSYSSFWEGDPAQRATVELINDFKNYIEDAAQRTGPDGVSARLIACVLFIEISNRPRSERQEEVEEVSEEIAELTYERHRQNFFDSLNTNIFLHKSFGVGQVKMSTLAMALGMIPLVEHDRTDNSATIAQIERDFMKLTTDQMWGLWKLIRWPKSHIDGVAKILKFLKNRANRYPHVSRADFLANGRAMAIVATEYNRGATSTPEAEAGPTWYGEYVANACLDALQNPLIHANFTHT